MAGMIETCAGISVLLLHSQRYLDEGVSDGR
jgi:hypothetical protein